MDPLKSGLNELNKWLARKDLTLSIVIIGAYALVLKKLPRSETTQDIDTVVRIDENILHQIGVIAESLGLPYRWLNDQASNITLPKGLIERAEPNNQWSNIKLKVATRKDLIILKASAFVYRRDIDDKDYHDLLLLNPRFV